MAGLISAVLLSSCQPVQDVMEDLLDSRTPRERYVDKLSVAGLQHTALMRDWVASADQALTDAPEVTSPHVESGFIAPSDAAALAYRIFVRRGQRLTFEIDFSGDSAALVFVDAWAVRGGEEAMSEPLVVADSGMRSLIINARRDGEIVVRAQPELLRGGRYSASILLSPILAFPVEGAGERDIGSVFGDDRDGGARRHHGIDIFAPRGTPVLAAAAGSVYRVQTTPVGGNVVWVRDTLGSRQYYAHLDSHAVQQGELVSPGDTIGFVGNTGNARSTPPHLHFGVYARGPVDPHWWVHTPRNAVPALVADTTQLGRWARVALAEAIVRSSPSPRGDSIAGVRRESVLRVVGAIGSWYRVRLPDGSSGFVLASALESTAASLSTHAMDFPTPIRARSSITSDAGHVLALIPTGERVELLGHFGDFTLVRAAGLEGWIPTLGLQQ